MRSNHAMDETSLRALTPETIKEYRKTLEDLRRTIDRVKRATFRYPVYLVQAGQAFRFNTPEDVDRFLAKLTAEIDEYDLSAKI